MPFAYYDRLSLRNKAIYRRSDEITRIDLPHSELLHPLVGALRDALESDDRRAVERAASLLARGILKALGLPPISVRVLAVRPSSSGEELHGLYTREEGEPTRIQLWMRTARHRRVVAFRTFLRTLLHELGHHIDYDLLKLADSFHTEGFFKRESSLFKQLVPEQGGSGRAQDPEESPPERK
ncbi:MAG: hypothetical protein LJF15_20810 [Acidobacteria bacterium]|jgi:hypothetical protein|nr:hypothetical protein [Acidobacteriota bacterium]